MGGTPSWAVPVGSLSCIVVVGLCLIAWWFPRTWQRGVNDEAHIIETSGNAEQRAANWERARETIRIAKERAEMRAARERGEVVDVDMEKGMEQVVQLDKDGKPVMPKGYAAI